jgi:hypothetical protein
MKTLTITPENLKTAYENVSIVKTGVICGCVVSVASQEQFNAPGATSACGRIWLNDSNINKGLFDDELKDVMDDFDFTWRKGYDKLLEVFTEKGYFKTYELEEFDDTQVFV